MATMTKKNLNILLKIFLIFFKCPPQDFLNFFLKYLPQDFLIFSASNPSRAPLPPPPSKSQQEITLKQPEALCLPTVQRRLLKCFLNARVFHNPFNYKGRLICPLPILQCLEGEISCFVVAITKAPAFEFTTCQQMDHRTSKPQPRSTRSGQLHHSGSSDKSELPCRLS